MEKMGFLGGIKLANGKELETTNPEDIYWFYKNKGAGTRKANASGGGKSKGARAKGRKTVHRPVDMQDR